MKHSYDIFTLTPIAFHVFGAESEWPDYGQHPCSVCGQSSRAPQHSAAYFEAENSASRTGGWMTALKRESITVDELEDWITA